MEMLKHTNSTIEDSILWSLDAIRILNEEKGIEELSKVNQTIYQVLLNNLREGIDKILTYSSFNKRDSEMEDIFALTDLKSDLNDAIQLYSYQYLDSFTRANEYDNYLHFQMVGHYYNPTLESLRLFFKFYLGNKPISLVMEWDYRKKF